MKKSLVAFICFFVLTSLPISAFASPGKVDSNGGHNCWTNCSQYGLKNGEYHYHNGGNSGKSTVKNGWQNSGGKWYYYSSGKLHKGWLAYGNNWYYLDGNGVMKTGWVYLGSKWYYLTSSGAMAKGWVKIGGTWYYLQSTGAMKTGWLKDGNKWYYLQSTGAMRTGWLKDGNKWYYLQPTGAMKTGWLNDGNKFYYLKNTGDMSIGWERVSGQWFYFETSGAMKTGWLKDGSNWYYLTPDGAMKTGWLQLGKDSYYFYPNGIMALNTFIDGVKIGPDGKAEFYDTELINKISSVASQFGFTIETDNYGLNLIYDGDEFVGVVVHDYVGGYGKYIDFLSAVSSTIGAPKTSQNIKDYFTQISDPSNPDYYESINFFMFYDHEEDWVDIIWGSNLGFNNFDKSSIKTKRNLH
ncbi:YHYH domain-containing protein [Neobacillus sp. NPDC058068]|uniref:YHYH domain-containing protein n=1 Tax=Neobacillus sp. NPDC058068 TaxID=3346325 RepID=UPI0036DD474A